MPYERWKELAVEHNIHNEDPNFLIERIAT